MVTQEWVGAAVFRCDLAGGKADGVGQEHKTFFMRLKRQPRQRGHDSEGGYYGERASLPQQCHLDSLCLGHLQQILGCPAIRQTL